MIFANCLIAIASAFFRSGQIEAWGRSVEKITEACKAWGKPEPFYKVRPNEVMIRFNTDVSIVENDDVVNNLGVIAMQIKIIEPMRAYPKITAK